VLVATCETGDPLEVETCVRRRAGIAAGIRVAAYVRKGLPATSVSAAASWLVRTRRSRAMTFPEDGRSFGKGAADRRRGPYSAVSPIHELPIAVAVTR
jgi:hypothetical protein